MATTNATVAERTIRIADLRRSVSEVLRRVDLSEEDAGLIADVLVDAELRGYDDHGVYFLGFLVQMYRNHFYQPRPAIRVVHETTSALLLDGDRGCGIISAMRAMRWCVGRAIRRAGRQGRLDRLRLFERHPLGCASGRQDTRPRYESICVRLSSWPSSASHLRHGQYDGRGRENLVRGSKRTA